MSREGNAVIEASRRKIGRGKSLCIFFLFFAPPDTLFFFFFYSNHFLAENGRPPLRERRTTKGPEGFNETISRYLLDHRNLSLFPWISYASLSLSLSFTEVDVAILPYFLLGNWRFWCMFTRDSFSFFLSKILKSGFLSRRRIESFASSLLRVRIRRVFIRIIIKMFSTMYPFVINAFWH